MRRAVDAWGLKLCAKSPDLYSETVSAVMMPEGFDGTKLVVHAADKYGVAFGVGLGDVAGKLFRIGHLGDFSDVSLVGTLGGVEMGLREAGVPHRAGGVQAALDALVNGT